MKTSKKILVLFLALMLASVTLLAGCGGNKTDYSALQKDVVKGSNVFVDESGVVFFGYNNLLCTAIFEDGNIFDYVVEGGFTGDIYCIAVYDNYIYVSASDGIFRYDLGIFNGSSDAAPEMIWDKYLSRYNMFQIYDGKMFFNYGTVLTCLPLEGGDAVNLAMEVGDFEVTSNGIYYSKKDGSLHLVSIDGSEDKAVGTVAAASYLTLEGGDIYYRDGNVLFDYSLDSGESAEMETAGYLGNYCYPWAKDGTVLYQDMNGDVHLIKDGNDSAYDFLMYFPFKYSGMKYKDWVVGQTDDYKKLITVSFKDGSFKEYETETVLADELSRLNGGSAGTEQTPAQTSYDIMEGWEAMQDGSIMYLYGNDFMLMMPNTDDWEYRQESGDSFSIYMTEPRTEGFGGLLVTIKAYDLADDSYTKLPSYSVAGVGQNVNKRFVAIFPTDVQFDLENSAQTARYKELLDHVTKIGEGAANSPFQTSDSD